MFFNDTEGNTASTSRGTAASTLTDYVGLERFNKTSSKGEPLYVLGFGYPLRSAVHVKVKRKFAENLCEFHKVFDFRWE